MSDYAGSGLFPSGVNLAGQNQNLTDAANHHDDSSRNILTDRSNRVLTLDPMATRDRVGAPTKANPIGTPLAS